MEHCQHNRYKIALSFIEEYKDLVETIAVSLKDIFGKEYIVYTYIQKDNFEVPELNVCSQYLHNNNNIALIVFFVDNQVHIHNYGTRNWGRKVKSIPDADRILVLTNDLKLTDEKLCQWFVNIITQEYFKIINFNQKYYSPTLELNINLAGQLEKIPSELKYEFGKWFFLDGKQEIDVIIHDQRIGYLTNIIDSLHSMTDPTYEDELNYIYYVNQLETLKAENIMKEKVITLCLKDTSFQECLFLDKYHSTHTKLLDYVKYLIEYDYKKEEEKSINSNKIKINVYYDGINNFPRSSLPVPGYVKYLQSFCYFSTYAQEEQLEDCWDEEFNIIYAQEVIFLDKELVKKEIGPWFFRYIITKLIDNEDPFVTSHFNSLTDIYCYCIESAQTS